MSFSVVMFQFQSTLVQYIFILAAASGDKLTVGQSPVSGSSGGPATEIRQIGEIGDTKVREIK